jgi:hypothetical protein
LGINSTQPDPKRRQTFSNYFREIRIGIGLMVQSDKKNDQIKSLRRYQIRSLIKYQSPIRTLTAVLDRQGAGILIQL